MAARLPVVISQSIRREPAAAACEEKLITELLFAPGLDATLIGPVESIELGSTDHLCLEGLKGPFALLGWTSTADCHRQLSRLGIHGSLFDRDEKSLASLMIETSKAPDASRRIDYYQLRTDLQPHSWVDALKQILESREVKAFSINLSTKSPVRIPEASVQTKQPEKKPDQTIQAVGPHANPITFSKLIDLECDEEAWEHLDSLLDDFDRADV